MTTNRKRLLTTLVTGLTVFSMIFNLALPVALFIDTARAQETTEEPAAETPAETPTAAVTDEPPPTPAPEITSEPTAEPATPVTEEPPLPPTPADVLFQENFQDGDTAGWLLSAGWFIVSLGDNLFLTTAEANQTATIADITPADFALSARLRIEAGQSAHLAFRAGSESYTLALDAAGNAVLYRGALPVAQGALMPPLPEGTPALWHTLNVQVYGALMAITLNGTPQIVYADPDPLPAGYIVFSAPTGGVSLDEIIVRPQDEPFEPPVIIPPTAAPPIEPTPEITPEAADEPEITPEATVEPELTPEITPEATDEPEITPEATVEPEITPEPETIEQPVLSADFEAEAPGWVFSEGASIVQESDTNRALLMSAGSTLLPAEALPLADFRLEARLNLLSDGADGAPTGLNIPFHSGDGRGYVLAIEAAQTALYRNDGSGPVLLASSPTTHAAQTWHTLALDVQGGLIVVTINETVEIEFTDEAPLAGGQIAFSAAGTVMLDDIFIYAPEGTLEATTPVPMTLSEVERARLSGALPMVLESLLSGDEAAALELAGIYYLPMDEENRARVVIWPAQGATAAEIAALVGMVGGSVDYLNDDNVEARLPLAALLPLANAPQIQLITPISTAVSTGAAFAPSGAQNAEGFDVLGVSDWHEAGFTGSSQKIAIIDTGFNGLSGLPAAERACVSGTIPSGGSSHGVQVVQVVCDIAPSATVSLFQADTASQLAERINSARSGGNHIILITLDLGADVSPGDGTGGGQINDVYTAIANAKNEGRLVVVSAGNSYTRYASFNHGGSSTVTIKATGGDFVRVRWNGSGITPTLTGPTGNVLFTANGTTGGFFNVPNTGACSNNFPITDDPGTDPIEAERNYCELTLTLTGGSGYVQVQVQTIVTVPVVFDGDGNLVFTERTRIITAPPGADTTSSIGRPADSPNALTVGAVCAAPSLGLPVQTTGSRGPIFSAGGSAPGTSTPDLRTAYKPDLTGPADIGTDDGQGSIVCDSDDEYGFSGTSAAAAHIAGIAALIRSNANVNAATPAAITNYLQSHAAELYVSAEADGFDMVFGAGLAVLGNPQPNYPLTNTLVDADGASITCPTGAVRFVNPNNLNVNRSSMDGATVSRAYIHPEHAAAAAGAGDCVILLPGEYVTPVNVKAGQVADNVKMRSYDSALNGGKLPTDTATPDSVFWVNLGGGGGEGGIFVTAANFTVDGFVFRGAHPQAGVVPKPTGILTAGANGTIIANNFFSGFTGLAAGGKPVRVDSFQGFGSQNVVVQYNAFTDNNARQGAVFAAKDSGETGAIVFQHNKLFSNASTSDAGVFEALIQIDNAAINVHNNRFISNATQSIIRVQNTQDSATPPYSNALNVSVFGNAFTNNQNTGPVVHLVPGRRFRFVNNTVAGHVSIVPGDYGYIIVRGTSSAHTNGLWEIHNNLFYSNNTASGLIKDFAFVTCDSISGGPASDNGAKNNWAFNSGATSGVCQNPLGGYNNRIVEAGVTPWFTVVGPEVAPDDPYQLVSAAAPSPDDGVDDGDNSLVFPASLLSGKDALNRKRLENVTVDIGAYEFKAVTAGNPNPTFPEDTLSTTIPLEAEGGFPPYTFTIENFPALFDTNPENACGGQPLLLNPAAQTVTYCPPKNLYTDADGQMPPNGAPAGSAVSFTYLVRDRVGNISPDAGVVTLLITPTEDPQLQQPINQRIQREAGQVSTPISFRLRPYVRFDDNFFFSEDGGLEDILAGGLPAQTQTPGADYPYDYTYVPGSLSGDYVALGIGEAAVQNAVNDTTDGRINLTAAGGVRGSFSFQYTVNESSATNTVTVEIVSSLPYGGLHDDTSFAFDYTNDWSPVYSEPNINNTLHQTTTLDGTATFSFVGTGFTLYIQGSTKSGFWELLVDDQTFQWNGKQIATRSGITCRTTVATGTGTSSTFINGKVANAYTVSCSRLRDGEAHTIKIVNKTSRALLSVDAVGILSDSTVLLPGFHEVKEMQTIPLFYGWNETTEVGASNRLAMYTGNPNVANIVFTFKGTGFAIGTTLEQERVSKLGATYTICVAPAATGTPQVCQNFDNGLGGSTRPVWNVFRPFFGFYPDAEYEVTIDITGVPAGGRMVIDSIIVFDRELVGPLPYGTTDDARRDLLLFSGGLEDTWALDTNNKRALGSSLTSTGKGVTTAGPFAAFQIPDDADGFSWWRSAGRSDSQHILICVDRGQLDAGDTQATFCITKDLRDKNTPNPLVISESDFGPTGWGTASGGVHTVEIFSLTNFPFNFDQFQVISSEAPLSPSYYEQDVLNLTYYDDLAGDGLSLTTMNNTRYSGGSQAFIKEAGEGVFFRFTGTGFAPVFTLDRYGGPVTACWLKDAAQTATPNDVRNNGVCQTFDNANKAVVYQAARAVLGLENATYAAIIEHAGADYTVVGRTITGNSMQFDALHIYGDVWNGLSPLASGARYETSYTNRAADNRFQYFGAGWRSVEGRSASRYSGQNYDQVRTFGAGVVFLTNNADTVRLFRDVRSGYTPLRVCYAPYTPGTFVVDYGAYTCDEFRNDGGTANQMPFSIHFGSDDPHVVSITTLTNGYLYLDAIEPLNIAGLGPLTPGIYPETEPRLIYAPTDNAALGWANVISRSYVDGAAMQSTAPGASLYFEFEGTGFSLLTLFDTASSSLQADINEIPAPPDKSFLVELTNATTRTYYGMAHSVTGLPYDTYQVLITETDPLRNKFTVDGIQVYGDFENPLGPGIYDDTDLSLTFGPANSAWTVYQGSRAAAYLNQTYRTANRQGATVAFAVTNANSITLHHLNSTSTKVQICATTAAGARTCSEVSLVGKSNTIFNLGAVGDYLVSITNLDILKTLNVDAIGVHNTTGGVLSAGIHQESSPLLTFGGGWNAGSTAERGATDGFVRSTTGGAAGQTLGFTFNGTGFSIVLAESTTTSGSYSLVIDGGAPINLPNAALTSARVPVALTYVGFAPGSHTVTLTNNDAGKPLLVDRVDVLGTAASIGAEVTGNIENDNPLVIYFPYFNANPVTAAAASNGSQHIGSMRGAGVYFQLNIGAFQYVRETSGKYGGVSICSAAAGTPSTGCTPTLVANNLPPIGYQQAQAVAVGGSGTRWVFIRNDDGKPMPLDYVRPTNPDGVLTRGFYEDTYAAVSSKFNFDGTFSEVPVSAASGGTVQSTTTNGGAALFQFEGTGFSVYFGLNNLAGEVEICWVNALTLDPAAVEPGDPGVTCQSYNNFNTAARYKAGRTNIIALAAGNYTAVARHKGAAGLTTMQVDAVEIYDDNRTGKPALDVPGQRYETSYDRRLIDDLFVYYGQGWRSVSGRSAARYSGENYDTIKDSIGGGISFLTDNGDAITLYRGVGRGVPRVEVCAQRVSDPLQRLCTTVANDQGSYSQPVAVMLNNDGYTGEHLVTVMLLDAGTFILDAVRVNNSTAPLQPGFYEDANPGLHYKNGAWTEAFLSSYSDGRARLTSTENATVEFSFTGATGFAVGMVADLFGGEAEVCYDTDDTWGAGDDCYTYQNESPKASYATSRTVTGLNKGTTYYVRVRNAEDNNAGRNPRYAPARLVIDYVNIFGDDLPPLLAEPGLYNEDAGYLLLQPAERWLSFSGKAARGFSNESYVGVVDDRGRLSTAYAGPTATLRLNVPAGGATVILYTGAASRSNPAQMLVCGNAVTGTTCTVITNLSTENQLVVSGAQIPALGAAGEVMLSFRALTPGQFRIDGFQVIHGAVLTPGVYDSFLIENGGLLNTQSTAWTPLKSAKAYGGWVTRTLVQGGTLAFDFNGTGFSVLTQVDAYGVDTRICYKLASSGQPFPANNSPLDQSGNLAAGDVICRTITTNTTAADWTARSGDRLNPRTGYQYGFTFHGLPEGTYSVQVRHVDSTIVAGRSALQVDAVAVLGTADVLLTTGQIYDDSDAGLVYGPFGLWTSVTARYGPSRGPWNMTEHTSIYAGALVQMRVEGNALILYQTASTRNSRKAVFCLTTIEGQQCADFSQAGRTTYFTPIAFYGFGSEATHEIIIENWDYGKSLSIDALQVLP